MILLEFNILNPTLTLPNLGEGIRLYLVISKTIDP